MNILLILAIVCEAVATLMGFEIIDDASHILGWIALGLVFFMLSAAIPSLVIGPRRA